MTDELKNKGSSSLKLSGTDIFKIVKGGSLAFISATLTIFISSAGNFDWGIYIGLVNAGVTLVIFFLAKFGFDTSTTKFNNGKIESAGSKAFSIHSTDMKKYIKCVVLTSLGYIISIIPVLLTGIDLGVWLPLIQVSASTISNGIYKFTKDTRDQYGISTPGQ